MLGKDLTSKGSLINSTWGARCDLLQFATEMKMDGYPVMQINSSGYHNLWGKTKLMFNYVNQSLQFDWVVKADTDTYIIMENLKNLLSHYNSSDPLFAGAMYTCR